MADPLTQVFNWNVIEGAGLALGAVARRFRGSGLAVAFQGGRVGAIGLDFFSEHHEPAQLFTDWSFVIKVVNPNPYPIAIEQISASWSDRLMFYAEAQWASLRMIHPKATLPDDGDEALPRLIEAGATQLFEVKCTMLLYRRWFLFKRQEVYTKDTYTASDNLQFSVNLKTNRGRTTLKS